MKDSIYRISSRGSHKSSVNCKFHFLHTIDTATNSEGVCPITRVFDNMTLKGGVEAGVYKDHGKIKDMELCRRICCEMTTCHLAFMLGETCFSVKCATVDACRAQPAKPSTYSPKV